MKAEELRLGNYVYNGGIISLDIERLYAFNECLYDLQPIQITEQWLLDLGFDDVRSYSGWRWLDYNGYTYESTSNKFFISPDGEIEEYVIVEYIHQLQNLYFALTGEELKIKE